MHLNTIIQKRADEEVLFVKRRHPLIYLASFFLFLIMEVLPIAVYFFLQNFMPDILADGFAYMGFVMIASLFMLAGWLQFYAQFVDYYLDFWAVTTKRIVNVEQNGLFGRVISELELSQVQDVTSEINGILPSIFQYGFVYVQSAGEKMRFVFEEIPDPHTIRKQIIELVQKCKKG